MKNILIVDDDMFIGNMLEETLRHEGYSVNRSYSGSETLLLLKTYKPDLILLDLMMPGLCGEDILEKINEYPIIVVSAKTDVANKIHLLQNGACDYLNKPFNIDELLARIAIHLKSANPHLQKRLFFDDIEINIDLRTITYNQQSIHLTRTEFSILKVLAINPTQIITKSNLLENISQDTPDCTDSSLKMHMSNLRKKLRELTGKEYIEAIWGIGFKLK
ncbi:response regulator transcription factor [Anaerorhabdus sp.]|uniref:response regulator transcription factor n=1 Tax=Anaerorhabdus sp. TaxID=1872524 RepID=UPI002FC802F4